MILNFFSITRDRLHKVATSLTLKDTFIVLCLMVSLFLNLLMWWYITRMVEPSPTPIPLHYNVRFGIDYIDFWYKAYTMPLLALAIILCNFTLMYVLYLKEKILSYFLAVNTVLVHLLLAISSYLILGLNA